MSNTLSPSMTAALAAITAGATDVVAIRDEAQLSPRSAPGVIKALLKRELIVETPDGIVTAEAHAAAQANEVPASFEDALAAAAARREAGTALEITPSGKVAKMVRVTLDLRISTDGKWMVAKTGEGDVAWTLYSVTDAYPNGMVKSQHATCTAAFAPENLA